MRIVSLYKPIPDYARSHKHDFEKIGDFDWIDALRMLHRSAESFGYDVLTISDSKLEVPHVKFGTKHENLMLWILEASLKYLESEYFDCDTYFVSPDSLINGELPSMQGMDIGLCVRLSPKYRDSPVLNSFQMWPVESKEKLICFYMECLKIAESLPAKWGNDTIPLIKLASPVQKGVVDRAGLKIGMFSHKEIMHTLCTHDIDILLNGKIPIAESCIIDFKASRKKYMKRYFRAVYENN